MPSETRLERRFDRVLAGAKTPRGAAVLIAVVSTSITVGAGALMTLFDHDGFPTIGSGLWWAVQTITTVGYGDHVPSTTAGQVLASFVMLLGIGFLTVITASITSSFVAQRRREQTAGAGPDSAGPPDELASIDERLERIEAALGIRS